MKKILSLVIILLFIGVAVAPSIYASDEELVELDVELCGLGKKHTVQLTQQETEEVELLFNDIEQQLSEVETREEAEVIFKDAVVELDKYGLLGGLSVRQAQRLVTREYQKSLQSKYVGKALDENENRFCLIAGLTSETFFSGVLVSFWWGVLIFINTYINVNENLRQMIGILWIAGLMMVAAYNFLFPFILLSDIYFQEGKGFIFTMGLNGIKTWGGMLAGNLGVEGMGVSGFTGLKILFDFEDMNKYFYLGTALKVGINVID